MAKRRSDTPLTDDAAPRLRRFRRPITFALLTLALIGVSAGSFSVGYFARAPERDSLAVAQRTIQVLAPVEFGVVDSGTSFGGEMMVGSDQGIVTSVADGRPVVTRQVVNPGDQLHLGGLIGSVAGVPYFALPSPLPLFRDLHSGDEGDDVWALQTALRASGAEVEETGEVDRATMSAIEELWDAADLPAPETIPYRQLVPIAGAGSVVFAAALGDLISEDNPLVSLRTSASYVKFRADTIISEDLSVGQPLIVQSSGTEYSVAVLSVGAFDPGGNGIVPGHDVSLGSADEAFLAIPQGTNLVVRLPGVAEETLRLPITAVRQDAQGNYVNRKTLIDGKDGSERVNIQALRSGGGWVAINEGELLIGDKVVIS